ncbi:MAG: hypothetical protein Q9160_002000 [Pyrenula sp. 1 TL-2023]
MATQFKKGFENSLNDQLSGASTDLTRRNIYGRNESGPSYTERILPRWDDATWSQFLKDLGDISTHDKRDNVDPHLAHLPLPKPDRSTFDLQIEKDTMCDATKFSVAVIPDPDPKKDWHPVNHKTAGEVAKAIHGAPQQDIAKASRSLMETVLAMAKPAFSHLSGESWCKPIFPAPHKRDGQGSSLGNSENSVDKIIDAARFWVLRNVRYGTLVYYNTLIGFSIRAITVQRGGGQVFAGNADQGDPWLTENRAEAHRWLILLATHIIVDELLVAINWTTVGETATIQLVHPLTNVLFDLIQYVWDRIKPRKPRKLMYWRDKRDDTPAYCLNVNDFKFLVENIEVISDNDMKDLKAENPGVCQNPKL